MSEQAEQVISVRDNADAERTEIYVDDELAGFVQYKRKDGLIALIHTEIDPAFGGRGLGGKLAAAVLDQAAEDGIQVFPFCPFINGYIQKHEQYVALVPEAMRAKFDLAS
jgi:predicted GNAT family acetyltransferase